MNKVVWKTVEAGDYRLEIAYTHEYTGLVGGKEVIPIWDYHVVLKVDGCVDYSTYCNGYGYDHECDEHCRCGRDYIHICDLEAHIEEMQELLKRAKEYYGEDWGK